MLPVADKARDALHLFVVETLSLGKDRQRIAGERFFGKHSSWIKRSVFILFVCR